MVDYFAGALYFRYPTQGVVFFTSAEKNNTEIIHGQVTSISIFDGEALLYGIPLGMTFDEIKGIHGEPKSFNTPSDNENSELYEENWTADYIFDDYEVIFGASSENGPVNLLNIRKLNE